MNKAIRMMDGHLYHACAYNTEAEKLAYFAPFIFDSYTRDAQQLAGNLSAARFSSTDDWMVYDATNGNHDAVYVGMIPAVFKNTATAQIITE